MTAAKAGLKLAVLVVAMLAAIGAWEVYKGTVKLRGEAQAQDTDPTFLLVQDIHRAVVGDGTDGPFLHFKCYQVTPGGPPPNEAVTVFDQFHNSASGGEKLIIRAPHVLCTPALKVRGR